MYLFLDYLEVLLSALLICLFCDIEEKIKFCFSLSVIDFVVMEFFQFYNLFGNELVYIIAIVNFLVISVIQKRITFYNFISVDFSFYIHYYNFYF